MSFIKKVPIADRKQYINDCCIGGDVVVDHLLPFARARYACYEGIGGLGRDRD